MSKQFHAVMVDETGCEFGVDIHARTRALAYTVLHDMYPESKCVQLESNAQANRRETRIYQQAILYYDDAIVYYDD